MNFLKAKNELLKPKNIHELKKVNIANSVRLSLLMKSNVIMPSSTNLSLFSFQIVQTWNWSKRTRKDELHFILVTE